MGKTAVVAAVAWLAMASSASAQPGLRLVQREARGGEIVLTIAPGGSRLVEVVRTHGRRRAAGGGLVDYRRRRTIFLDPAHRAYASISLRRALAGQRRERRRLLSSRAAVRSLREQKVKPPPRHVRLPRAHLRRAGPRRRIAGLLARPVVLAQGRTRTRLWYGLGLPGPPPRLRRALARLAASSSAGSADRALRGRLDDVVLRREVRVGGRWRTVLDTVRARHVDVPARAFRAPAGWRRRGLGPRRVAAPRSTPASVVPVAGGPVLNHPDIFAIYWGSTFPGTGFPVAMDRVLSELPTRSEYAPFWSPLAQYGVTTGTFRGSTTFGTDPFVTVGSWNFGAIEATVTAAWASGAPAAWWRVGGHDPVIAIFVDAAKVASGGWSGYHLWAASPAALLPWPASLLAYPAVPWFIVKAPDVGGTPSARLASSPASHELVEAATDPFPFSAFVDPLKVPVWAEGEIADICQSAPSPFGSEVTVLGNRLETYWSNAAQACVPATAISLTIFSPTPGQSTRADRFLFSARADSPIDGDVSRSIAWRDERGRLVKVGNGAVEPPLSLGAHTLTARVTDSNGQVATATRTFTITADPPAVGITSPAAGESLADDHPVRLRGTVGDPQGRAIPPEQIRWLVDGASVGTGPALDRLIARGQHTVALQATNFWGQTTTATRTIQVAHAIGHSPVVTITQPPTDPFVAPTAGTIPIPLAATVSDAEDGALSGASVRWFDSYPGVTDDPVGQGAQISTTLPWRQVDQDANVFTEHTVRVEATDGDGNRTSATVHISVGILIT